MNEKSGAPTGDQTESPSRHGGPRVTGDQMRDVDRLRRSSSDRYVAGVAGGLGRHFDIDPTIIRVLLVVLSFFGGAGVLIYAAVWLFVPEDDQPNAPIEVSTDVRRIVLIAAGVIALSVVFGTPFLGNGWGNGFPVPLLVIGIIAIALFATRGQRRETRDRNQPPPPWGSTPAPGAPHPPEGSTMTATTQYRSDTGQPPAWMPPPAPAYAPPPRPRRTGLVLFWPTLALIAIGLGTLGVLDAGNDVNFSAYAALAVAITGVMLLVGAFVGRPGGLIALGLLVSGVLVVTGIAAAATGGDATENENLRFVPTSATEVDAEYRIQTGSIELDLTDVPDLAALDGRSVDIEVAAGEVFVRVPEGLNVTVDADLRYAGQIDVGDVGRGGPGHQSLNSTLITSNLPGTPDVELVIDARVGQITVEQD